MKQYTAWCVAFVLALIPLTTGATAVLRSGESVVIEPDREVLGNFYGSGGTITISGPVQGDAYLLGGTIVVNAPISEDLVILGGEASIHGDIGEDVRVIAGNVTIDGAVEGDVVVLAGTVHILSTAELGGDLLLYGGDVIIDGPIDGAVYGAADKMRIRAAIAGPVELTRVGVLTLGEGADLQDVLIYASPVEHTSAAGAEVDGEVTYTQTATLGIDWVRYVEVFAALFVLGAVFFYLARPALPKLFVRTREHVWRNALIGTGTLVALPVAAVVLIATVIGAPVGLFLLFLYPMLLLAGFAYMIVFAGAYIHELLTHKQRTPSIVGVFLGSLIIWALLYVPFFVLLAILVPLGALVHDLYAWAVRHNR